MSAACISCDAPVLWAIMSSTGSRMPLDPEPKPDGNIALIEPVIVGEAPLAIVIRPSQLEAARRLNAHLYRSHFASCPYAARHRRPQRKEKTK